MATVTITIPDAVYVELGAIAQAQGHASVQAILVSYLRELLVSRRATQAAETSRRQAKDQAEIEGQGIA